MSRKKAKRYTQGREPGECPVFLSEADSRRGYKSSSFRLKCRFREHRFCWLGAGELQTTGIESERVIAWFQDTSSGLFRTI